ncbi:hypothetical protein C8J57DRAFT_1508205 [Mycena rebaudengoi]|nr:hypothetical protein C8J57DRAFT_1508205 [Mycena rebaudengoi]
MDEYLQSLPEEAVKELLQVASDGKLTSYFAVAALTFLIYDHLLSFDLEIRFIWMRPKSLACYLYIWTRYLTLAITWDSPALAPVFSYGKLNPTRHDLHPSLEIYSNGNLGLSHLQTIEIAVMFIIVIKTILENTHYAHAGLRFFESVMHSPSYSRLTLLVPAVPTILAFYPVPSLIVTFAMFVMTLYNYRSYRGVSFTSRNTLSLVDLFFRDGVYWFLVVIGSSSSFSPPQIIMWAFARQSLKEFLITPSIVAYSIVGSRVLLNIMEAMNVDVMDLDVPSILTGLR